MNILLIILMVALAYLIFTNQQCGREKFVEVFAKAGYEKTKDDFQINVDSNFNEMDFKLNDNVSITHDELRMCLVPTIELIKKETGLCVSPVETTKIKLYENNDNKKLYKCKFMFMTVNTGFPFGFGIEVDVIDGKIIKAQTQSKLSSQLKPFTPEIGENFLPASELFVKPNLAY